MSRLANLRRAACILARFELQIGVLRETLRLDLSTGMASSVAARVGSGCRIVGSIALCAGAAVRAHGICVVAIERITFGPNGPCLIVAIVVAVVVSGLQPICAARPGSSAHLLGEHRSNK